MIERKPTQKQEKFCQVFIETGNASEAYRRAYPKSLNWKPGSVQTEARETLLKPVVKARVRELRAKFREKHNVTVGTVAKEFDEIKAAAMKNKQYGPAVSALDKKVKLYGLYENHNRQKMDSPVAVYDPRLAEMVQAIEDQVAKDAEQAAEEKLAIS